MSQPPPCPASERFAALIALVAQAVAKRTGWALTPLLIGLIVMRLQRIKRRFLALAARLRAGPLKPRAPRRAAAPSEPAAARPARPRDPLPRTFGWLRPLVAPETIQFAGMLEALLQDPEMVAVMQAAPEATGRILRPFCRMIGVAPPPVIAPPPRRRPVRRQRPQPPPEPRWPHDPRKRNKLGFYIGPPPFPSLAHGLGPPRRKSG